MLISNSYYPDCFVSQLRFIIGSLVFKSFLEGGGGLAAAGQPIVLHDLVDRRGAMARDRCYFERVAAGFG